MMARRRSFLASLALLVAVCVGGSAQATAPAVPEMPRPATLRAAIPDGPSHLRSLDTSKITARVLYRVVPSHGGSAISPREPLPAPASILLLGSGLIVLSVLVRKLLRRHGP